MSEDGSPAITNPIKVALSENRPVVGCVASISDPYVAEIMGQTGLDFVLIDTQHSPITVEGLQQMMVCISPMKSPTPIIVRVAWNDIRLINQALDLGADGIILPWINTEEEAKQAVAAAKFPPVGKRSWGPRRAIGFYNDADEYASRANDNVLVWPQIEHIDAVNNLDRILSVEGVDGIMIGPADLAYSMGYGEDKNNPAVDETIKRVLDGCKRNDVPFGMFTGTLEIARKWLSQGGLIATVGSDTGFIAEGASRTRQQVSELLASLTGGDS